MGTNLYGFLPGMAKTNLHMGLGWRISLFPAIPNSAFFSLFIFILNIFKNWKHKSLGRLLIILLSVYFLILSGSRTAILAFAVVASFKFILYFRPFHKTKGYLRLSFFYLAIVLVVYFFNSFTLSLYNLNNSFINSLVFKSEKKITNEKQLEKQNYRIWLWDKHFEIYKENPIFGKGSYEIKEYLSESEKQMNTNFTESYLTDLMVKVGIFLIFFIAFFFFIIKRSVKDNNPALYGLTVSMFILMISYGSFIVPYNFLFLVFVGNINNKEFKFI
ncbi:MAG: O-antigen ligase family protein [Bacteroidales bacterium]|nr:O-antigen ligase family protein [Bacteroidales bacterium]